VQRTEYNQQDVFDSVLGLFTIESKIHYKKGDFIERLDGSYLNQNNLKKGGRYLKDWIVNGVT